MPAVKRRSVTVVVPVYNEELTLIAFHEELSLHLKKLNQYDWHILFINDGSTDRSSEVLTQLVEKDNRVSFLEFSRNFGKELATSAGLQQVDADAALVLDADLQHPPRIIHQFLQAWEEGADMVIGVRNRNQREGVIKKLGSLAFYQAISLIADTEVVPRSTDFRLLDRSVLEAFRRFTEHNRMTRGLLDWLGFKKAYIYFDADMRLAGNASYSVRKLFKLALSSFTAYSLLPLRLAGYLGLIIMSVAGPFGLFIYIEKFVLDDKHGFGFSGLAVVAVSNLFFTGLILSCLGLIALYIANIHAEVMNRPLYVIRRQVGNHKTAAHGKKG